MAFGQLGAIQGMSRRRLGQSQRLAQINQLAPSLILAKQRKKLEEQQAAQFALQERMAGTEERAVDLQETQLEQDKKFKTQELGLLKDQMKASEAAGRRSMGVEGLKLGVNLMKAGGGSSIGDILKSNKFTAGAGEALGSFGGNLTVGSTLGSGLAGFGAANLFGGSKKKNKLKRAAIGAGAGALLGGFSTGSLTGGGIGAAFGGLGSFF
jgi:hypothetical protein